MTVPDLAGVAGRSSSSESLSFFPLSPWLCVSLLRFMGAVLCSSWRSRSEERRVERNSDPDALFVQPQADLAG